MSFDLLDWMDRIAERLDGNEPSCNIEQFHALRNELHTIKKLRNE